MIVTLPVIWLIVVNILAWLIIHIGIAWLGTQLPENYFDPNRWPYFSQKWESNGVVYESFFAIRIWKDLLPDGAAMFKGGFRKKNLLGWDPEYLERFEKETCRGEAVHWIVFAFSLLFFLWNPWWVGIIMVLYGIIANIPCIVAQRYNRIKLARIRNRLLKKKVSPIALDPAADDRIKTNQ